MVIRIATPADAYSLAELRWEFRSDSAVSSERTEFTEKCAIWFERALASDQWIVTVAEINGTLIGCVCLQCVEKVPTPEQHTRHWGYLTNTYVNSTYRNNGIGKKMLESIVRLGYERKLELLIVWPSVEAVSLYKKVGFNLANEMHKEPGDFPPMELVY